MPFRVVYGYDLPPVPPYIANMAWASAVDQQLTNWDEFLTEIHDRLE
jgi:hypothetical protein